MTKPPTVTAAALHIAWDPDPAAQAVTVGALILGLLAAVLPSWLRPLAKLRARCRMLRHRYRTLRRLYPLWRALQPATAPVAPLPTPSSAWADSLEAILAKDVDDRIHLRVIGIRDAHLALRPWQDPELAAAARRLGQAAGLDGEELEALVDAVVLAHAIHAKRHGRPPRPTPPAAPAVPPPQMLKGVPIQELVSDVTYLQRVATYYATLPTVRWLLASRARQRCSA